MHITILCLRLCISACQVYGELVMPHLDQGDKVLQGSARAAHPVLHRAPAVLYMGATAQKTLHQLKAPSYGQ